MFNLLLIVFSSVLYAQDAGLDQIPYLLNQMSSLDPQINLSACGEGKVKEPSDQLVCDAEPLSTGDYQIFQVNLDAKESKVLDNFIPGEVFQSTQGGVSITLALPNDNKMMGLWAIAFRDGDDRGNTHGVMLKADKTLSNGLNLSLQGSSNLYSSESDILYDVEGLDRRVNDEELRQLFRDSYDSSGNPIEGKPPIIYERAVNTAGKRIYRQNFTNDNAIKLVLDNINKGKTFYFKAGVGWTNLDSKNYKSALLASGQQDRWHELLNFYTFEYEQDGRGSRHGISAEGFLGLQHNLVFGQGSCRLRSNLELGGEYSSLGASSMNGDLGFELFYQKPGKKFASSIKAGATSKLHSEGVSTGGVIDIGLNFNRLRLGFEHRTHTGTMQNHMLYNVKNKLGKYDSTMSLKMTVLLGRLSR